MSSAKVYVTFNPSMPMNARIFPPKLTLTSDDVEIVFSFKDSPGMIFKTFNSDDKEHQLRTQVDDTAIIVTDLDDLPETIQYTLTLADAFGHVFVTDPQIINNPKASRQGA